MSLLIVALLGADAFEDMFDQGVRAYEQQNFEQSIQSFERLIAQGVVEPEVFFNLGNAYYRTGRLGAAIASYERVLQIDPTNEGARDNLTRAVARTERSLPRPKPPEWEQAFFFWHANLTSARSFAIAASAWALAWAFFAVRLVRHWPYLRLAGFTCIAIALLFAGSWWIKSHPEPIAVAAQNRVPVRYGHRAAETVRFELYEGDRVRVDQIRDGWVRIETHDGERGWTEEERLHFVGPPYRPLDDRAASSPTPERSAAADAGSAL